MEVLKNDVVVYRGTSYRECKTMERVFKFQDSVQGVTNVYKIIFK